jgi:hypothetical protein
MPVCFMIIFSLQNIDLYLRQFLLGVVSHMLVWYMSAVSLLNCKSGTVLDNSFGKQFSPSPQSQGVEWMHVKELVKPDVGH